MSLADLRKIAIRQTLRIRFQLPNGMECILNEHGVAEIPSLRAVPDFNLETELRGVEHFVLEPVSTGKEKTRPQPRKLNRVQVEALASGAGDGQGAHDEHE